LGGDLRQVAFRKYKELLRPNKPIELV
jgi:hypothetical protein